MVDAMADLIAHRGPDQSGLFTGDQVTLGHRRLSVLDLTESGRQPMGSPDGAIVVVYNGEIYNFATIRHELERAGYTFRSTGDTEVVLHAYHHWGPACVDRFDGMFAFAVWDARVQELFLARDRIGIKPLYYSVLDDGDRNLVFASEIKAMLPCSAIRRDLDPEALYQYMGFEFIPSPRTIFSQVRKLLPGHCLTWKRGEEPQVRRYWQLRVRAVERTPREHQELLAEALERSVRDQLVSDVPLGVFLSGGIDSSAIVAMMHRLGVTPLETFTLHYGDASYSELEYARFVADHFGARLNVMKIDPISPAHIETCCWHLDEPMTDLSAIPFYLLCQEVRRHVTVCLSGEGGDELLCGYDRFKASRLDRLYRMVPLLLRRDLIERVIVRLADRPQKKGAVNFLKRFVEGSGLVREGRHMRWQYFLTPRMQRDLFRSDVRNRMSFDAFAPVRKVLAGADCEDAVGEEIYLDTCMTLPDSLLAKADKLSMAHGLEVRVPMLGHEFVDLCCTIPSGLKMQGLTTKAILRKAMKGIVPNRIRQRGKQGYSLPIKAWLRGELREYMEDSFASSPLIREYFDPAFVRTLVEEHVGMRANHNHVLWALVNLATWHRLYVAEGVSAPAPGLPR